MIGGIAIVAALGIFLAIGLIRQHSQKRMLAARAEAALLADSIPRVNVTLVVRAAAATNLTLPATLQSNHEANVFARATGYVKAWYADIGRHVHAGEVLAVIEAPEVDQQLAQARQQMAQAHATLTLFRNMLDRSELLYKQSVLTKQTLDSSQANYDASIAAVAADTANVRRLEALVGYEQVKAPFDGVVTARNVDVGTFVTATGSASASPGASAPGTQLFAVAQTDTVRIYVGVPEAYVPSVRVGLPAGFEGQELSGRTFVGHVTRTAESVDIASRTLLTEVDALNGDAVLLPGMYAEVHFQFHQSTPPMLIPSTAMIFQTGTPQAAVVGADSIVHFRALRIGRDYGAMVEVDSGLANGAYIVVDPTDDLRDGQHVHAQVEAPGGVPPGGTGGGGRPEASDARADSGRGRSADSGRVRKP